MSNMSLESDVLLTVLTIGQAVDRLINELHLNSSKNDVLHIVEQARGGCVD